MAVALCVPRAEASVVVWQDPVTKLSASYPDRWEEQINIAPDDKLTVVAPGVGYLASCRLKVREDRRFVVYPVRYSDEIQRLHVSADFWAEYLNQYEDVTVHTIKDNAGLGRGFASFAEVSFTPAVGVRAEKRGVMLASIYNGKLFVAECSSKEEVFDVFSRSFMSFMKSVNFRKEHFEFPSGHYRHFLDDCPLRINGARDIDMVIY